MALDPAAQALLDATDLPTLIEAELGRIGRDWSFQRRGDSARGCCPFRDDAGSTRFRVRGNTFTCFGDTDPSCAGSGDAITFLRHLHGWTFDQALTRLAEFTGLARPTRRGPVDPRAVRQGLARAVARSVVPGAPPAADLTALEVAGWTHAVAMRAAGRLPPARALGEALAAAGATDVHLEAMHFPAHREWLLGEAPVLVDAERAIRPVPDGPSLGADGPGAAAWAMARAAAVPGAFGYTTDWRAWLTWLGRGYGAAVSLDPTQWDHGGRLPHELHREPFPVLLVPARGAARRETATMGRWLLSFAPRLRVLDLGQEAALLSRPLSALPTYIEWMVEAWQQRVAHGRPPALEACDREMQHVLQQVAGAREHALFAGWWTDRRQTLAPMLALPDHPVAGVSLTQRRAL